MPQLFKTDPRDSGAEDTSLTTADLAHANERPPSAQFDGSPDGSTGATTPHSDRNRTTFNQENAAFFDRPQEDARSLERSDGNAGTQFNPSAATQRSMSSRTDSSQDEYASTPLFAPEESNDFHVRWDALQVSFVDEPRRAVQQADSLVAAAMKRLAEIFADERATLDKQWDRGDSVSTEDLRIALRRYRSFFGRLLSV